MNEDEMIFKARCNKPRRELSMPALTFHHSDNWMKTLGLEVFSAWLMVYTWCDRKQYPEDHISHHKDIKEVAEALGCGVNKAQEIIKTLYEYGLIDIVQVKNKYGGYKNIYYWHEIPIYADSMYSELKEARSWEDRNWHGQELARLRKVKNEKEEILRGRIQNEYGSENSQENSGLVRKPYQFSIRQPYSKSIHINDLNNKKRSVVDPPAPEKISEKNQTTGSNVENDSAAFNLSNNGTPEISGQEMQAGREEKPEERTTWEKIREQVRAVAGADISMSFAKEIEKNYPPGKVSSVLSELRRQLDQGVEIRGIGAWLRYALDNDIQPDQPAKTKVIPRGNGNNRTRRANSVNSLTPEQVVKKTVEILTEKDKANKDEAEKWAKIKAEKIGNIFKKYSYDEALSHVRNMYIKHEIEMICAKKA